MYLEVKVEGETDEILVKEVLRRLKAELGTRFEHDIEKLGGTHGNPNNLPFAQLKYVKKIRALYKVFHNDHGTHRAVFIAVLDLDDRNLERHRQDFAQTFPGCEDFVLIIAIKEVEAWLMGDMRAIKRAFRNCMPLEDNYSEEKFGNKNEFYRITGCGKRTKKKAFERIVPHMRFDSNKSPSFQVFLTKLRELLTA